MKRMIMRGVCLVTAIVAPVAAVAAAPSPAKADPGCVCRSTCPGGATYCALVSCSDGSSLDCYKGPT